MWPLFFALSCGSESGPKYVDRSVDEDSDTGREDWVDPEDDTGEPDVPTDDTGEPDVPDVPDDPVLVEVSLVSESVTCESPELRDSLGPMSFHQPAGDWLDQNGAENLWTRFGGSGLAIADFDDDGRLDLFLPHADGDQLYMGQEGTRFVDESDVRLPPESDVGVGATPVDIDGDGDLDIFVGVYLAANRVLINDGSGIFTNSSAPWLLEQTRVSHGSSWADIDGDDDLDVYVSNYSNWDESWLESSPSAPTEVYRDTLWLNEGGGEFANVDDRLGTMDAAGAFTFASGFWDMDDDGDADLLSVNDYRYEYEWAEPMRFLVNDGGHFTDADDSVGLDLEVEGMGLAVGELNGDGQLDVAVQAWATHLMLSDGSHRYIESAASKGIISGVTQQVGWGISLADMNNDGRLDIPVAYGLLPPDEVSMGPIPELILGDELNMNRVRQPNAFYLQDETGQFSEVGSDWGLDHDGISRSVMTADLNADGFLDVVTRDLWGPTRINLSRCDDSAWLSISLRQSGLNPFAVGAKLTVVSGETTQIRFIEAGSVGLASGGPPVAHVGLGLTDEVDRIDVRWPDGAVSSVSGVDTRALIRLTRD